MRFRTDDDALSITLDLDDDDPGDLTRDGIGVQIMQAAASALLGTAQREQAPDGRRWARLRPATVHRKGHELIGLQSGAMLAGLSHGDITVAPRSATWAYPAGPTFDRAHGFHNGRQNLDGVWTQPARPLVGWTPEAEGTARALVALLGAAG